MLAYLLGCVLVRLAMACIYTRKRLPACGLWRFLGVWGFGLGGRIYLAGLKEIECVEGGEERI